MSHFRRSRGPEVMTPKGVVRMFQQVLSEKGLADLADTCMEIGMHLDLTAEDEGRELDRTERLHRDFASRMFDILESEFEAAEQK